MRRIPAILSVVGIASALLLVGVPAAQAVEPPPPPVTPSTILPSTYVRTAYTSGSSLIDGNIAFSYAARQAIIAKVAADAAAGTSAAAAPLAVSKGVAITKAAPMLGGVGGILTAGFMAGWMVTDGTLSMFGNVTGTNPMASTCAQPEWAIATIQTIYPFSAPSCTAPVGTPNADVTPGLSPASYGGWTITYLGTQNWGSTPMMCYQLTGSQPAGVGTRMLWTDGNWVGAGPSYQGPPACSSFPAAGTYAVPRSPNPFNANGVSGPAVRMVNSGGTILSQMVESSADPNRTPKCTLTWPGGSTTTATGAPYKESAGMPLQTFNSLCNESFVSKPGHGPDLLPTEVEIGSIKEGGTYAPIQELPVPEFTPDEKKGLTPGTTGGLVLQKVVGTLTSSCMNWDADCAGWWPATSNGTNPSTTTGTYRCTYNGSTVNLSECGIYRNTFDTRTSTPTITDPATGAEQPWVSGTPSPGNSTSPATGPTPGGECMASWPSAPDPLSWVFHPVRCAFVWAFVPRTVKVEELKTDLDTKWRASTPGALAAAAAAVSPAIAGISAGDCGGIIVPFPVPDSAGQMVIENRAMLAACPGDFFADIAPVFFWFNTGGLLIGGFFAVRRMLDRLVGNT